MSLHWHVLRSKPNKEDFIARQLEARNVEIFYPRLSVKPVNPRARKIKPYFPGYLFIHIDLSIYPFTVFERIPGVANLVSFGGDPASVPDNVVSAIRSKVEQINASGGEVLSSIHSGDWVKIEKGPFEGYEGIFDTTISGTERVRVLLKMLEKRQLPVEMPAGFVTPKKTPPHSR
jgi:transcriptional antiterminator RfaH